MDYMELCKLHNRGTCRYDTCSDRLHVSHSSTVHMHCSGVSENYGKKSKFCVVQIRGLCLP